MTEFLLIHCHHVKICEESRNVPVLILSVSMFFARYWLDPALNSSFKRRFRSCAIRMNSLAGIVLLWPFTPLLEVVVAKLVVSALVTAGLDSPTISCTVLSNDCNMSFDKNQNVDSSIYIYIYIYI
jgi:hypothetical protein